MNAPLAAPITLTPIPANFDGFSIAIIGQPVFIEDGEISELDDVDAEIFAHLKLLKSFKCWGMQARVTLTEAIETAFRADRDLDPDLRDMEDDHEQDIAETNAALRGWGRI